MPIRAQLCFAAGIVNHRSTENDTNSVSNKFTELRTDNEHFDEEEMISAENEKMDEWMKNEGRRRLLADQEWNATLDQLQDSKQDTEIQYKQMSQCALKSNEIQNPDSLSDRSQKDDAEQTSGTNANRTQEEINSNIPKALIDKNSESYRKQLLAALGKCDIPENCAKFTNFFPPQSIYENILQKFREQKQKNITTLQDEPTNSKTINDASEQHQSPRQRQKKNPKRKSHTKKRKESSEESQTEKSDEQEKSFDDQNEQSNYQELDPSEPATLLEEHQHNQQQIQLRVMNLLRILQRQKMPKQITDILDQMRDTLELHQLITRQELLQEQKQERSTSATTNDAEQAISLQSEEELNEQNKIQLQRQSLPKTDMEVSSKNQEQTTNQKRSSISEPTQQTSSQQSNLHTQKENCSKDDEQLRFQTTDSIEQKTNNYEEHNHQSTSSDANHVSNAGKAHMPLLQQPIEEHEPCQQRQNIPTLSSPNKMTTEPVSYVQQFQQILQLQSEATRELFKLLHSQEKSIQGSTSLQQHESNGVHLITHEAQQSQPLNNQINASSTKDCPSLEIPQKKQRLETNLLQEERDIATKPSSPSYQQHSDEEQETNKPSPSRISIQDLLLPDELLNKDHQEHEGNNAVQKNPAQTPNSPTQLQRIPPNSTEKDEIDYSYTQQFTNVNEALTALNESKTRTNARFYSMFSSTSSFSDEDKSDETLTKTAQIDRNKSEIQRPLSQGQLSLLNQINQLCSK